MSIEAMKQALEALHNLTGWKSEAPQTIWYQAHEAITSLRQAIAEAEKQERMVCVGYWNQKTGAYYRPDQIAESHKKLLKEGVLRRCYTHTQAKREWVGLNWDDLPEIYVGDTAFLHGAKWAEAKLRSKNT